MTPEEKIMMLETLQTFLQLGIWLTDVIDDAVYMKTLSNWGVAAEAVAQECKEQLGLLRLVKEIATVD